VREIQLTKQAALKITCGRCINWIGSNGAPAFPAPYAPPPSIFLPVTTTTVSQPNNKAHFLQVRGALKQFQLHKLLSAHNMRPLIWYIYTYTQQWLNGTSSTISTTSVDHNAHFTGLLKNQRTMTNELHLQHDWKTEPNEILNIIYLIYKP